MWYRYIHFPSDKKIKYFLSKTCSLMILLSKSFKKLFVYPGASLIAGAASGRHIFAFEPDQGLYENKLVSLISHNPPPKKTLQFLDLDDDCDEHVTAVDMDCDIGALL